MRIVVQLGELWSIVRQLLTILSTADSPLTTAMSFSVKISIQI